MIESPSAVTSTHLNMFNDKTKQKISDFFGITNRIFGYFEITVEDKKPERFINLINRKKLRVWKLKVTEDEKLSFRCSMFSAYSIINIAKQSGFTLNIGKGIGLPFVIGKYQKRTGLIVGTLLASLLVVLSGFFIWDVRIVGQEMTPELYNALKEVGCHSGQYILGYDVSKAKHEFLLKNNEYSFFAINIRGTVAYVELKERTVIDKTPDDYLFCHIVAEDDAQIVDITATHGKPVVKPGDIVEKGQQLVSGEPVDKFGVIHPVKAVAVVNARMKKNILIKIPLKQNEKHYTGKTDVKISLYTFGKDIDLFLDEIPKYEQADVKFEFNRLSVFDTIRLPVDAFIYKYSEFTTSEREVSVEEAKSIAEKAFSNQAAFFVGDGLLLSSDKEGKKDTAGDYYILSGEITYIKNIAVVKPFDFMPTPDEPQD